MEHYELMSVIEPRRKKQYLRVTISVKTDMCTTPTMRFVHILSHSTSKHTLKQKMLSLTTSIVG